MTTIDDVRAREVLDSRGNPTVEADVTLASGIEAAPRCPRAPRTGAHEAVELRDGGDALRRQGRPARPSRTSTTLIAPEVLGLDALDQAAHRRRDARARRHRRTRPSSAPTPSSACRWPSARAAAAALELPLYRYLGGTERADAAGPDDERPQRRRARRQQRRHPGVHDRARWASTTFSEALRAGAEIFHALKKVLQEQGLRHRRRRRGRLRAEPRQQRRGPRGASSRPSRRPGYTPGEEISLALDPAATEFYRGRRTYLLEARGQDPSRPTRWSTSAPTGSRSTRSSPSRTASPRTTGTAGPT